MRARIRTGPVVLVVFAISAACGQGGGGSAAPSRPVDPAVFGDLPRLPGSQVHTDLAVTNGGIVRTYRIPEQSPREIIEFYGARLPGWWPTGDPSRLLWPTLKVDWLRADLILTVTASASAPSEGDATEGEASLYTLALRRTGRHVPASLEIAVDRGPTMSSVEATLRCSKTATATGFLRGKAEAACDSVDRHRTVLLPPAPDRLCGQQYGGPESATISGSVASTSLERHVDRQNSCGIADWAALRPLLAPAT